MRQRVILWLLNWVDLAVCLCWLLSLAWFRPEWNIKVLDFFDRKGWIKEMI